jgi:hypothetical protein
MQAAKSPSNTSLGGLGFVGCILFLARVDSLNAQAKSKAAHILKSIFCCSTLKKSEN